MQYSITFQLAREFLVVGFMANSLDCNGVYQAHIAGLCFGITRFFEPKVGQISRTSCLFLGLFAEEDLLVRQPYAQSRKCKLVLFNLLMPVSFYFFTLKSCFSTSSHSKLYEYKENTYN